MIVMLLISSRGGAISLDNQKRALKELLALYVPLVSLVIGFHFGKSGGHENRNAPFWVALVLLLFWFSVPFLLFATSWVIEDSLEMMDLLHPFGESIVTAGLGFYFGKN